MRWFSAKLRFLGVAKYSTAVVKLRPYQEQCLDACTEALANGATRIGVSLPTGSGKTTVFISLLSRIPPPTVNPTAVRSLIVVNSVELARQSAHQVTKLFPEWTVEIEQGSKHKASGSADVTVATYQTLMSKDRISKFDPNTIKAIIVDEAHHAAAPSYRQILSYFCSDITSPDPESTFPPAMHKVPVIGFTATFGRHDGLALGSVFESIVYHRDFVDMIKEQWLCDVRFTSVKANINLDAVTMNSKTGDFNRISLAQAVNTETVRELVVKTWLDRASTRKSTLVFCVNISHVVALTQNFRNHGVDARFVHSKTPTAERKDIIAAFKAGEFPVLLNCAILTEGADIPNIDCVVIARPTCSRTVFSQMIGRGVRQSKETGKIDCRVIDLVDSIGNMLGVISAPTLLGVDPNEINTDDETFVSLGARGGRSFLSEVPQPKSVTYLDYENPFSLVEEASGAPRLSALSKNAWVGCGDNIYVLECLGKGFVRVEPTKGDEQTGPSYRGCFTPAMLDRLTASSFNTSPYMRSRQILTAQSLGDAIRGCDTYVKAKIARGYMANGLRRTARWREDPASDAQKKVIEKRWRKGSGFSSEEARVETINNLTKGQAANILTRLKHGAQTRYEKKVKENSRISTILRNEQDRKARETVQVGPLRV